MNQDPVDKPKTGNPPPARFDLVEQESRGLFTISHCRWLKITSSQPFSIMTGTQGLATWHPEPDADFS
jgi:hypothetical protein